MVGTGHGCGQALQGSDAWASGAGACTCGTLSVGVVRLPARWRALESVFCGPRGPSGGRFRWPTGGPPDAAFVHCPAGARGCNGRGRGPTARRPGAVRAGVGRGDAGPRLAAPPALNRRLEGGCAGGESERGAPHRTHATSTGGRRDLAPPGARQASQREGKSHDSDELRATDLGGRTVAGIARQAGHGGTRLQTHTHTHTHTRTRRHAVRGGGTEEERLAAPRQSGGPTD